MRRFIAICVAVVLTLGLFVPAWVVRADEGAGLDWEYAMNRSLVFLRNAAPGNPMPGNVGSDWVIISLARAGWADRDDFWIRAWLTNLERIFYGSAHPGQWSMTDFQRVTLVLTALGLDARDFVGFDLTFPFSEFVPVGGRAARNRTINADIFALIALEAGLFDGDRADYVSSVLTAQRGDGSWGLNPNAPSVAGDLSITGMALQALVPYYDVYEPAREAVRRGLAWAGSLGFDNPECLSQLIIALAALAGENESYSARTSAYVALLLDWFDPVSGGFRRPGPADPVNHMATEQAALALVAYWRFVNGKTPLYAMGDGDLLVFEPFGGERGLLFHPDVNTRERVTQWDWNPAENLTRGEFTAVITAALGLPLRTVGIFEDVPAGSPFAGYIDTAFYYGIVGGTSATTFHPSGLVTRQEAAVMITRAAGLLGLDTEMGDVEVLNILAMFGDYRRASRWAWGPLAFSFREGILCDEAFYIRPLERITRGEVGDMVYGLLTRAGLV